MKKLATAAVMLACMAAPAYADMHDDAHMKAMVDEKFSMMDTNGDGMVSKEEYDAAMTKMFNDADTNGDGMLSKDEMMAAKKAEWSKYKGSMSAPVSNNTKTNKTTKHK